MRVGSLFSGIGGLDLGLERAGMEVVWQCEIDEKCRALLKRRFRDASTYPDVTTIGGDVESVDLICGGFPCQDLSVAGKRTGLAGERSGLFHEFMRVAAEIAPRWLLIENVPGILSSNGGRDMGTIVGALGELGYGWAYRVLDAQYYGVAQRRRRVFIVGCLGDARRAAEVLLEPESLSGDSPPSRETGAGVAALTSCGVGTCGADDNQAQAGHLVAKGITHRYGKGTDSDATDTLVTHSLTAEGHDASEGGTGCIDGLVPFDTTQVTSAANYSKPKPGDPCHPLAAGAHAPAVAGSTVRRLTPTECERLQGFPDGWTDGQADSPRYQQLGNAVCVPVAEWIGRRIMAVAS